MANKKKEEEDLRAVVAEYKVSMHCNACERTVAKIISMFKGVETFRTDMNKQKVVVTGRIDPQKLLKKLKKKTRKEVEIVANKKEEEGSKDTSRTEEINVASESFPQQYPPIFFDCCKNNDLLMAFSDENPNACSIM
ncbi:heavy metal-associated isoprenylated plant protein 19 [Populus alba x Populus x berolinensis]|nr:heavy metal-associated isoprenylated plant protein 19 [Populus alba x Populus x berolinensis]